MNIEKIISAWKADEDEWDTSLLASPVGTELTEEDLLRISGGDGCVISSCTVTCPGGTCTTTCNTTVGTCGSTCGNTAGCFLSF